MQTIAAGFGGTGQADVITATSTEGTSLVSTAVSFEVTGSTGGDSYTEISCAFTGSGVTSSAPVLRLYSQPDGMAQMMIFASIDEGSTATLGCTALIVSGDLGSTVGYRWDGGIGQRANTSNMTPQNNFTQITTP
jgi:hypothetical protein